MPLTFILSPAMRFAAGEKRQYDSYCFVDPEPGLFESAESCLPKVLVGLHKPIHDPFGTRAPIELAAIECAMICLSVLDLF